MTGARIHEIIGMTETAGVVALAPASAEPVLGSVGYRIPYTDVTVRKLGSDGVLGGPCAPHEIGVLTISGPHVTPGYRDPSHNASSVRDGYLDSGDLAYTDEAGRIFIAGRSKDLIIRSGHNIDSGADRKRAGGASRRWRWRLPSGSRTVTRGSCRCATSPCGRARRRRPKN